MPPPTRSSVTSKTKRWGRCGGAVDDLARDVQRLLRTHPDRVGRQAVLVPHRLEHRVDLDDAAGAVGRERRALPRQALRLNDDGRARASLQCLGDQAVEGERVLRIVRGAERGGGLRAGRRRANREGGDRRNRAQHLGTRRTPEPGVSERTIDRRDGSPHEVRGVAVVGGGDRRVGRARRRAAARTCRWCRPRWCA